MLKPTYQSELHSLQDVLVGGQSAQTLVFRVFGQALAALYRDVMRHEARNVPGAQLPTALRVEVKQQHLFLSVALHVEEGE